MSMKDLFNELMALQKMQIKRQKRGWSFGRWIRDDSEALSRAKISPSYDSPSPRVFL